VELNNLLQGYPVIKVGQEGRAWKRLRDELYPKPDIIGMPKRFAWNLWGGVGLGSCAVIAFCAVCWYEVLSPFGAENNNPASGVVPASFRVPAADGDKPILQELKPPQETKRYATPTNNVPAT
jgi:hypothetical protein